MIKLFSDAPYFRGTTFAGATSLSSAGDLDGFLIRVNGDGSFASALRFGGGQSDCGTGVAVDGDDNVLLTGLFSSGSITFGDSTLSNAGARSMFVTKFDSTGTIVWANRYGASHAQGNQIAVDGAGNVLVSASYVGTTAFGSTTLMGAGDRDAAVVKFDPAGTPLWAVGFGGTGSDNGFGVAADSAGNVAFAGDFMGMAAFDSIALTSAGNTDVFVGKLDGAGNLLQVDRLGGTGDDSSFGLTVDGQDNILNAGAFTGPATFAALTLSGSGGLDAYVLKLFDTSNSAPTIDGTLQQSVNDNRTVTPFFNATAGSGVTVADDDEDELTVTVSFTAANGTFTAASLTASGFSGAAGSFSRTGSPAEVTAGLRALVFDPTDNQASVGATTQTGFTLTVNDGTAPEVSDSTTTVTATSVNDAPVIDNTDLDLSSSSISEGGSVTLSGSFLDGDPGDAHTVVINWGDGSASTTLMLSAGDRDFQADHSYLDDPANSAPTQYTITVTVTDDADASDSAQATVTVNNLVPTVTALTGPTLGVPGQPLHFAGSFTDAGTLDTHTVSWTARRSDNVLVGTDSDGTFSFVPPAPGTYTVTFRVTDDHSGAAEASQTVTVTQTLIGTWGGEANVLLIGGTAGADKIRVAGQSRAGTIKVTRNGATLGTFAVTSFGSIAVFGLGGNDV